MLKYSAFWEFALPSAMINVKLNVLHTYIYIYKQL